MQCFRSFHMAERTIEGIEALHMLLKGQAKRLDGRDAKGQAKFVMSLFGVVEKSGGTQREVVTMNEQS